ncbi:hypothetical protein JF634_00490 [Simonsiella muelleri]|nr:hypothetical protein [Simonsiella muelleri]UBQ54035.1 hypothetical protein JF634_00490 [Simonsiella muelleri]
MTRAIFGLNYRFFNKKNPAKRVEYVITNIPKIVVNETQDIPIIHSP